MIKFIKSPVGQYHLGYAIGDTASFPGELEKELIVNGYAVEISEETNKSKSGGLQPDDTKPGGSEAVPVSDNGGNGSGQHHNKSNKRSRTRD